MITAAVWDELRKKVEIPFSVWHEYYLECGGVIPDLPTFTQAFSEILAQTPLIIKPNGNHVRVTFETATIRLHNYYNKKFGI